MENLPPTPSNQPIRPPYGPPIGLPYTVVMDMNSCVLTKAKKYQMFETEAFIDEFES